MSEHKANPLEVQVGGDHYAEMRIQPIEFAQANKLGSCETLALRYICRHKRKGGREDIEKAIHALELLIELEYEKPRREDGVVLVDDFVED